ncbi:MAG: ankyrin repeat domain-containing protein, partial [Desulfovibrionales bacterium]|nr:ankyrin repeat domain-containing protein [Desulfovibrionales bacterium]
MSRFLWKVNAVLFLIPVLILSAGTWAQLPTKVKFTAICVNDDHQHLRDLFSHASQDLIQAWINKPFDNGFTPLSLAVNYFSFHQCTEVIKLLSESGAEVNYVYPDNGNSVLMAAARYGYTDIVKVLLKAGANVNYVRSLDGWSVLMIAASKGHTGTVRVLLDAGARVN